ncbi:MAG: twin-arginine translocase TatA/TatE family subunit [Candidatus Marinamargulisbacteria bacterium]
MFGSTELIVIALIVFILFGAKSIPKFAKSIGEARKEFQKGIDELNQEQKTSSNNKSSDSDKTS